MSEPGSDVGWRYSAPRAELLCSAVCFISCQITERRAQAGQQCHHFLHIERRAGPLKFRADIFMTANDACRSRPSAPRRESLGNADGPCNASATPAVSSSLVDGDERRRIHRESLHVAASRPREESVVDVARRWTVTFRGLSNRHQTSHSYGTRKAAMPKSDLAKNNLRSQPPFGVVSKPRLIQEDARGKRPDPFPLSML